MTWIKFIANLILDLWMKFKGVNKIIEQNKETLKKQAEINESVKEAKTIKKPEFKDGKVINRDKEDVFDNNNWNQ